MWLKYLKVWASGIHVYDKLISFFFIFSPPWIFSSLSAQKLFFFEKLKLCDIWIEFRWTRFFYLTPWMLLLLENERTRKESETQKISSEFNSGDVISIVQLNGLVFYWIFICFIFDITRSFRIFIIFLLVDQVFDINTVGLL